MGIRTENAKGLYIEGIREGRPREAVEKFTGERYTQHSTGVADGQDGFVEFFDGFLARNPERDIRIVRAFEDGRSVFLHVHQVLGGGATQWVTADLFDTDDQGRIVEHWDVIQEYVESNPSGRSMVDGPTEPIDLDKTDANKSLVQAFIDDVLISGRSERITDYVSTKTYHQHNPTIADGLDGLAEALAAMAVHGETMAYARVHKIIGCGSFVVALSEMTMAGTPMAAVDLFRVDDGKIVEHWDAIEPIPSPETARNSGKF
jgi:predicted SnoaL-like aldol condensation-catalyzing enzyme